MTMLGRLIQTPRFSNNLRNIPPPWLNKPLSYKAAKLNGRDIELQSSTKPSCKFRTEWLRDNCRCEKCFSLSTGQRLIPLYKNNILCGVKSLNFCNDTRRLNVNWQDGHGSSYDIDWLLRQKDPNKDAFLGVEKVIWDADTFKLTTHDYNEVLSSDEALEKWLTDVYIYGISAVKGTPVSAEATKRLSERISYIKSSQFGDFWVVEFKNEHKDIAYKNCALSLHTDNSYYDDPAGLQLFHILNHNGTGGLSSYGDGFRISQELRKVINKDFSEFLKARFIFHSLGDGKILHNSRPHPIIRLNERGEPVQIRYNGNDRSPQIFYDIDPAKLYHALSEWERLLDDPKYTYWMKCEPGTVVLTDNWRVFHGRSEFTGDRILCGSYHAHDAFISRLAGLRRTRVTGNVLY